MLTEIKNLRAENEQLKSANVELLTLARALRHHLNFLNEENFDHRYEDKMPCCGCFQAVLDFNEYENKIA